MQKRYLSVTLVLFIALVALVGLQAALSAPDEVLARPPLGVSNMDSLHLRDYNLTATPNFVADQLGLGAVAEFRDGGTPVARIPNGGGLDILVGDITASGGMVLGTQAASITATWIITPTAPYITLDSSITATSSTSTPIITSTATVGQQILLHNINAVTLTLDGTGGTVECGGNVALGEDDMVALIYTADSVWRCIYVRDN